MGIVIKLALLLYRYFSSNEMDEKPGGRNVYRQATSSETNLIGGSQLWCSDVLTKCLLRAVWQKTGARHVWPVHWKESPVSTTRPPSATTPPSTRWAAEVRSGFRIYKHTFMFQNHSEYIHGDNFVKFQHNRPWNSLLFSHGHRQQQRYWKMFLIKSATWLRVYLRTGIVGLIPG